MNTEYLEGLKGWFEDYYNTFDASDDDDRKNYVLKKEHTEEVYKNAVSIAMAEGFSAEETVLAGICGLLHDVGRFAQYSRYKTFKDSISVNHGLLGSEILLKYNTLMGLDKNVQDVVLFTVKYHNVFKVPDGLGKVEERFLRLVRDADKLDIWSVFLKQVEIPQKQRASAALLGLPESSQYNPEIITIIMDKQVVPLNRVITVNDYHLLRLSWIYDLHYKASFQLLFERQLIAHTLSILPQDNRILELRDFLNTYTAVMLK
ncbi:MAG: HD domain-containing protein [Candidatus Magnetoovum sp. WYHC-5]|nr:HD domain-containing protein [Candidatus Magnetoovum sp. WYHC-5]